MNSKTATNLSTLPADTAIVLGNAPAAPRPVYKSLKQFTDQFTAKGEHGPVVISIPNVGEFGYSNFPNSVLAEGTRFIRLGKTMFVDKTTNMILSKDESETVLDSLVDDLYDVLQAQNDEDSTGISYEIPTNTLALLDSLPEHFDLCPYTKQSLFQ